MVIEVWGERRVVEVWGEGEGKRGWINMER